MSGGTMVPSLTYRCGCSLMAPTVEVVPRAFVSTTGSSWMRAVIHTGYGEGAPNRRGPDQDRIKAEGNSYLEQGFPDLDYVYKVRILPQ